MREGSETPFVLDGGPWERLCLWATSQPAAPFLVEENGRTEHSYADVLLLAQRLAVQYFDAGVRSGSRILVRQANSSELVVTLFALWRIGAIALLAHRTLTHHEAGVLASRTAATHFVCDDDLKLPLLVALSTRIDTGATDLREIDTSTQDPAKRAACVLFTSGSTGRPKGVVLTAANLAWGGATTAAHLGLKRHDRSLVVLPMSHINGLVWNLMATLWSGGSATLVARYSTSAFWNIAASSGSTWAALVAFHVHAVKARPEPQARRLRFIVWGLASRAVESDLQTPTQQWYGMTETVGQPVFAEAGAAPEGSMGFPSPYYTVRVVDDRGFEQEREKPGELLIRVRPGLTTFLEYLDDPESTAACTSCEGWFHTGDRVKQAQDGSLYFFARAHGVIRVGGENCSAVEIENELRCTPRIEDAIVFGAPHPLYGEQVIAVAVSCAPWTELRTSCDAIVRRLAPFKRPVEIYFLDSLPRLGPGKADRATVASQLGTGHLAASCIARLASDKSRYEVTCA